MADIPPDPMIAKINRQLSDYDASKCDRVFEGSKPTSCGRATYTRALQKCDELAAAWEGASAVRVSSEYSADYHIATAGSLSSRTNEERANELTSDYRAPEFIAFFGADGGRHIRLYTCDINPNTLKLTQVAQLDTRPVR